MSSTHLVLGIETSCDETAAALVDRDGARAEAVLSQTEHEAFGGVVPEIAARAHLDHLDRLIEKVLDDAHVTLSECEAIAVTSGPGLGGGLVVGVATAQALSLGAGVPVVGINHLEGHALTPRLTDGVAFPYLLLLVSGGHTQIVDVRGVGDYRRLATTIDDACGEAFDKTAKLLSLGYPGGPAVEDCAKRGDANAIPLPRPRVGDTLDMSFSGLKTAVRTAARKGARPADVCAAFQDAVADVLCDRVARALDMTGRETLVVAGGVAANAMLRERLERACESKGAAFVAPPLRLCTDNAAMIAWAGVERLRAGLPLDPPVVRTRWPLDERASPRVGHGKRGAKV